MAASSFFEPCSAPHKTKRFWLLVALGVFVVLTAPLVQILLGLPLFPLRVHITSGVITFVVWVSMIWLAIRFGRIVWFAIALFFLGFALFSKFHS
jgi:hypothetical protein